MTLHPLVTFDLGVTLYPLVTFDLGATLYPLVTFDLEGIRDPGAICDHLISDLAVTTVRLFARLDS